MSPTGVPNWDYLIKAGLLRQALKEAGSGEKLLGYWSHALERLLWGRSSLLTPFSL